MANSLLEFVREHPDMADEAVIFRFPDASTWDVRRARRQRAADEGADDAPSLLAGTAPIKGLSSQAKMALSAGFFRPITVSLTERRLPKPLFKKQGEHWLILSDLHAPDVDWHALDLAIQIGQSVPLAGIIIDGDGMDVHSLSRYTPAANRPFRWVDERAEAVKVFIHLREQFPKTPIYYVFGNHCVRPETFMAANAPQLQGLFDLPTLLGINDLGFIFPKDNRVILGDSVMVKHGTKVRGEAGASVAAEVKDAAMSVIMGHVHRLARVGSTRGAHRLKGQQPWFGIELGCLCNLQPDYLSIEETANWQHGFAVATVHSSGLVSTELVEIVDGRAAFRGLEFTARLVRPE